MSELGRAVFAYYEHRYLMLGFCDWLTHHNTATLLQLLESADFFDAAAYNAVFVKEMDKLLDRIHDPDARQQVAELRGFDFGNYIARSLARAGFRGDDVQEHFHDVVVKLLLAPGRLFSGWQPSRHGPLDRRFKASVWNAIKNIAEKRRNYRRLMVSADPAVMADVHPGRAAYSGVLDDFRRLVGERLGALASAVLDTRLQGGEVKDLVGQPELGAPTAYAVKRAVAEIKKLARWFAERSGDAGFLARVERAMAGEAATAEKRVAGRGE